MLIGAELDPVNYRPQFLVALDIIRAGVGSRPAPIVTPLRRSFLNLLQSVAAHPSSYVTPAPIHGWEQLADLLKQEDERWRAAIADSHFTAVDSDTRFERVLKALVRRPKKATAQVVKDGEGRHVARVERGKERLRVTVDNRLAPDFGAYLVEQLPEIYAAFRRRSDA